VVCPPTRPAAPAAALLAVLARLPFLSRPPSPDEAGFLLVGQQWHPGGTSLYGSYWVDRPPLLVTIFGFAADLGGLVPLRLIGCLATVAVVLGSARVARRIAGPQAAAWTAAVAGALCVSPLLGGLEVNGELLAAPFVVAGVAGALGAIGEPREGRAVAAAALAGAATVAALLVKQNMADVAVFSVVAVLVARRRGEMSGSRLRRTAASYVVAAVVTLAAVAGWTLLHGTSLTGVFDAMYPFRVEAERVLASSNRRDVITTRLWLLLGSWLLSGGAVVMGVVGWALLTRRLHGAAAWGLVATMVFDVVSIALGGNYWHHYLIQLVVPVAVVSGVLVARRQPGIRVVLVAAVVVAGVAWGGVVPGPATTTATSVGKAVGRVAKRGDTIISARGHADITEASGLRSPYPYLWSLPARTLDPRFTGLDHVLAGPHAATWFVTSSTLRSFGAVNRVTERLLSTRYHRVADLRGRSVYLLDGVRRAAPRLAAARPAHRSTRSSGGGGTTAAPRTGTA